VVLFGGFETHGTAAQLKGQEVPLYTIWVPDADLDMSLVPYCGARE